jgi:hypothetical protein
MTCNTWATAFPPRWRGDQIKLTAGANVIFLEPEVCQALERFVRNGEN